MVIVCIGVVISSYYKIDELQYRISKRKLTAVINARVDDLLLLLNAELADKCVPSIYKIFLTGGSALLFNY